MLLNLKEFDGKNKRTNPDKIKDEPESNVVAMNRLIPYSW